MARKIDHKYSSDDAMESVLEIVRGWDDAELAAFLAECIPGETVKVGDEVRLFNEKAGKVECV